MLREFVELEKPWDPTPSDDAEEWIRESVKSQKAAYDEIMLLYRWWTKDRFAEYAAWEKARDAAYEAHNADYENEGLRLTWLTIEEAEHTRDDEMLLRLSKLGGYDRNNSVRRAIRERFTDLVLCLIGEHLLNTGSAKAVVLTGMALGFDQDVACACIRAEIPFVACVPFLGQERLWPEAAQVEYQQILSKACGTWVGQGRVPGSKYGAKLLMDKRNEYIVDNSDIMIACWDGSNGGTSNCVCYASTQRKRIQGPI